MTASEGFGSSSTISTLYYYQVLLKIVKLMCGSLRFFPFWHTLCAYVPFIPAESWGSTKSLKVEQAWKRCFKFTIMLICLVKIHLNLKVFQTQDI